MLKLQAGITIQNLGNKIVKKTRNKISLITQKSLKPTFNQYILMEKKSCDNVHDANIRMAPDCNGH